MEACEIAGKAIEVLETDGWGQGNYFTTGYCAFGALYKVLGIDFANPRGATAETIKNADYGISEVIAILRKKHPHVVTMGLASWNDQTGRNKQEVIEVFQSVCE